MNFKKPFVVFVAILIFAIAAVMTVAPQQALAASIKGTIVIDPGHNVEYLRNGNWVPDSGAVAPDGTTEASLTLQISAKLCQTLSARGYKVYTTLYVPNSGVTNLLSNSTDHYSLDDRVNAAATVSPDLFIAVHVNSAGDGGWSTARGLQVLYDSAQAGATSSYPGYYSVALGNSIWGSVHSWGGAEGRATPVYDQAAVGGATVIRDNPVPAVTVETGFLTNQTDLGNLKSDSYQTSLAGAIANGVDAYLAKNAPDTTPPTMTYIDHGPNPSTTASFWVAACGVTDNLTGVKNVRFAVWSEANGQDDIKWVDGTYVGNNNWTANLNAADHNNEAGLYDIHMYGTDNRGNTGFLGSTTMLLGFKDYLPPVGTSLTPAASTYGTTYKVTAAVADDTGCVQSGVASVRFAVWTDASNQADLRWISAASNGDGTYSATINASDFGNKYGVYHAHCYATDKAGNTAFCGATSFTRVQDTAVPTLASLTTSTNPSPTSVFTVTANGVTQSQSGVQSVRFVAWSEANGQDDLKWYNGVNDGNGNWTANISALEHNNESGIYDIHAYGVNNQGVTGFMGATTMTLAYKDYLPPVGSSLTPVANTYGTTYRVTATVTDDDRCVQSGVASVRFAVWTEASNQADLKWITAASNGDGTYSATINSSDFGNKYGLYHAHCYATDNAGNTGFCGATSFTRLQDTATPTLTSITTSTNPSLTPTFSVTANGVSQSQSGVQSVRFAVWSETGGQDDLRWYNATNDGNGNWTANINAADHKNDAGLYDIHAYGVNGQGVSGFMGCTNIMMAFKDYLPPIGTYLTPAASTYATQYRVTAAVADDTSGAQSGLANVRFAVWTDASNQADLKWITAASNGDGTYSATINASDFGNKYGLYHAHCYATDNAGNTAFCGATSFTRLQDTVAPTLASLTTSTNPSLTSTFSVTANGVTQSQSGVQSVRFAAWSEANGQDDLKWYNGVNDGNGNWTANISASEHNNESGIYDIHAYGVNGQGVSGFMGCTTMTMAFKDYLPPVGSSLTPTSNTYGPSYKVTATVADDPGCKQTGVASVRFAVWTAASNQADLKWITAVSNGNGTYTATINLSDFGNKYGVYNAHCYATDTAGNTGFCGATSFTLLQDTAIPSLKTISTSTNPSFSPAFTVTANGVSQSQSGVQSVRFGVWSENNGQDDFKWVNATNDGSGNWSATINASDHNNDAGLYDIHIYGVNGQGVSGFMGCTNMTMTADAVGYAIMGTPMATVAQMAKDYNSYTSAHGWAFPSFYASATTRDSRFATNNFTTITQVTNATQLAQMYYDIATKEGVRPEVAWAQMCDETGYLQFGGQVKKEQLNFAGIGAVDTGYVAGATFHSIEEGIIAQVQHLKAYGSTLPANITYNGPIDPRFNLVSPRGCAPMVQMLSGKWAIGSTYGNDIMQIIARILTTPVTAQQSLMATTSLLPMPSASTSPSASPEPSASASPSVSASPSASADSSASANPTASAEPSTSESPTPSATVSSSSSPEPSASASADSSPAVLPSAS